MNKGILKLIRSSWIPCKFQQQKAISISSTLHAHKKPGRKHLNVTFTLLNIQSSTLCKYSVSEYQSGIVQVIFQTHYKWQNCTEKVK